MLDETSEGRETRARAKHHNWYAISLEWKPKLLVRWLDGDANRVSRLKGAKIGADYADELTVTAMGCFIDDAVCYRATGGRGEGRRGDGVVARTHWWKHGEVLVKREVYGIMHLEDVQDASASFRALHAKVSGCQRTQGRLGWPVGSQVFQSENILERSGFVSEPSIE